METPFSAYQGDEPYIFVCYAHDDAALVYPEITRLHEAGFHVWYDEGVSPGSEWSESLAQHIQQCAVFLYFVTPRSVEREHCRQEVNFALDQHCTSLSVHLEPTEVPLALQLSLSHRQAILKQDHSRHAYQEKLDHALEAAMLGHTEAQDIDASAVADKSIRDVSATNFASRRWPLRAVAIMVAALIATANHLTMTSGKQASRWALRLGYALVVLTAGAWWYGAFENMARPALGRIVKVEGFEPIGASESDAVFSKQLKIELTSILSGYPELSVISDSDNTVEANYVVRGGTLVVELNREVTAKLIRNSDTEIVWSDKLIEKTGSAATEIDLATQLARFIRFQVVVDEGCEAVKLSSRSAEAARHLCEALADNWRINQGGSFDLGSWKRNLDRSIELDPNLVDARWLLSAYYRVNPESLEREEANQRMQEQIDAGMAIDDGYPFMHWAQGTMHSLIHLDYELARTSFQKAIDLEPLSPHLRYFHAGIGQSYLYQGNLTEALRHYRRAINLHDADARMYEEYARVLNMLDARREALDAAEIGLSLVDQGPYRFQLEEQRLRALLALGKTQEANNLVDDVIEAYGVASRPQYPQLLVAVGRIQAAQEIVLAFAHDESLRPETKVRGYMAIGAYEEAIDQIHICIDERTTKILRLLRASPMFDDVRGTELWDGAMSHLEAEEDGADAR